MSKANLFLCLLVGSIVASSLVQAFDLTDAANAVIGGVNEITGRDLALVEVLESSPVKKAMSTDPISLLLSVVDKGTGAAALYSSEVVKNGKSYNVKSFAPATKKAFKQAKNSAKQTVGFGPTLSTLTQVDPTSAPVQAAAQTAVGLASAKDKTTYTLTSVMDARSKDSTLPGYYQMLLNVNSPAGPGVLFVDLSGSALFGSPTLYPTMASTSKVVSTSDLGVKAAAEKVIFLASTVYPNGGQPYVLKEIKYATVSWPDSLSPTYNLQLLARGGNQDYEIYASLSDNIFGSGSSLTKYIVVTADNEGGRIEGGETVKKPEGGATPGNSGSQGVGVGRKQARRMFAF